MNNYQWSRLKSSHEVKDIPPKLDHNSNKSAECLAAVDRDDLDRTPIMTRYIYIYIYKETSAQRHDHSIYEVQDYQDY